VGISQKLGRETSDPHDNEAKQAKDETLHGLASFRAQWNEITVSCASGRRKSQRTGDCASG